MEPLITVLTATYNRATLLPDLFASLCRQTDKNFAWLIVDDGSTDNTCDLVRRWQAEFCDFPIGYVRSENGGKNRAINLGVTRIMTPFTMIVDSDDYLTDDAVAFLSRAAYAVRSEVGIAGIAGLKGEKDGDLEVPELMDFTCCNNLERSRHQLQYDACEVFKTHILREHPFTVWPGEKFVPEEVVWNQLALEGYRLRWYRKVTCVVRYQKDGLTKGSWKLFQENPMGYAMLFNHRLMLPGGRYRKVDCVMQFIACCFLGRQLPYLLQCHEKALCLLLLVPGWFLSLRRKKQFRSYVPASA